MWWSAAATLYQPGPKGDRIRCTSNQSPVKRTTETTTSPPGPSGLEQRFSALLSRTHPTLPSDSPNLPTLFPHSKVTERSKYFNMVTYTVTGIERRLTEALISLYHVCGVCPLEIASILTLVKQDVICPGSTCTLPLALSTGATQRGFAVESGHLHLITSPF